MNKYLFKNDRNIYKANLHCHTTVSDGAWTPEQTKEMYKAKGYGVVAFTDHDILINHSYLNDDEFLALNACEVELIQSLPHKPYEKRVTWTNKVYHFNLYSINPNITQTPQLMSMDYDDIDAINKYIKDRTEEGFLVCYNHPFWSLQTYEDYSRLKGCFAMEIYNRCGEVTDGYYGYNTQVYDEMLRCQNKIYCMSTDDNHSCDDAFGGFVMINSSSLKYEDIREALNEAEFKLNGNEKYIRVMCRDKEHKDANSNAFWL